MLKQLNIGLRYYQRRLPRLRFLLPPSVKVMAACTSCKAVFLDCDGVMTNGTFAPELADAPSKGLLPEKKDFSVRDGYGISRLRKRGIQIFVVSGNESPVVKWWGERHHLSDNIYQGIKDKRTLISQILQEENLSEDVVVYLGDDLPDLVVRELVGAFFCPRDAEDAVLTAADFVSERRGGSHFVREIMDMIFDAQFSTDSG